MALPDIEHQSQTELVPQYTHEQFLEGLYERIIESLQNGRHAATVEEVINTHVDDWERVDSVPLGVDIQKGVLLKDGRFDYAVVLGNRSRTKYDRVEALGLQFGALPQSTAPAFKELSTIDYLRLIANRQPWVYGSGEIYIEEMFNKVKINCWADERIYGGPQIRNWPQERLLSDAGIVGCVSLVSRTIDRAFS